MNDDSDLDALLSAEIEPLSPPAGSWQAVRRRARRRRFAKLGLSVAAIGVVAAGAIPAVFAVRDHQDDQRVALASEPSRTPNPQSLGLVNPLTGFTPISVSFVSQTNGFLLGTSDAKSAQLAITTDGGVTWGPSSAPHVDPYEAGMRFADSNVGFIFGKRYYATTDSGHHWTREPSPGPIVDLETMNGRVWALVRPTGTVGTVVLYQASLVNPTLVRVKRVAPMSDQVPNGDSIAVQGTSVTVVGGSTQLWSSPDGVRWRRGTSPCAPGKSSAARLAQWIGGGLVMACGTRASGGMELKEVFESTDSGESWTTLPTPPSSNGQLSTLGAGTSRTIILGTSGGGAQLTADGGVSWRTPTTGGTALGFVGFIDEQHVVALPDSELSGVHEFLWSDDAGAHWTVTSFPG